MTPEKQLLHWALQGSMPLVQQTPRTRAAYAADWKGFSEWCRLAGETAMPATRTTVLTYCHALLASGHKVTTVQRHLSAINSRHREHNLMAPATRDTREFLTAIKRMRGEQPHQKRALTIEHLRAMVATLQDDAYGLRDKAVLLVGFSSALRRGTLVGLDVRDVEFRTEGLVLTVRREKQDKRGDGRIVGVAKGSSPETCPVDAVRDWLAFRGAEDGPLFTPLYHGHVVIRRLHPARIARIVKDAAERIGLDPAEYGGHSMRSGCATTGLENGVNEIVIATHLGHKNLSTTRRYFRRADPFRANPSGSLGL